VSNFIALYDACVFYPAPVRDFFVQLALTDLFRAKWSASIHDEWTAAVARDRPDISKERLERTRTLVDDHVRDCLVTGFEYLISVLDLPDPDDRHVLAAAIHGRASVIVTYNLSDFTPETLSRFDIEAQHPDMFASCLMELSPAKVVAAARQVRERLCNPRMSAEQYLDNLEKQALVETVSMLRAYEAVI
jgi:predicted nucleic acid-binding protein